MKEAIGFDASAWADDPVWPGQWEGQGRGLRVWRGWRFRLFVLCAGETSSWGPLTISALHAARQIFKYFTAWLCS